jgi:hypothetical protein
MATFEPDPTRAAEILLDAIAPERSEELRDLWTKYGPEFRLLDDSGSDGSFVLDAGAYRLVRFNHRVMRLFWLGAYIAFEGYTALHKLLVNPGDDDFVRFRAMIEIFERILRAPDPASVPLPDGVPPPGVFPPRTELQPAAAAQLAAFCAGWALLHELKHIQHQQDGTSAPFGAPPEAVRAEEFSCDEYATKFMLERAADYAGPHSVPEAAVRFKRETGIYFALFTLALVAKDRWGETDTHPALQVRIAAVRAHMGAGEVTKADAIAHAAFGALWTIWPNAPGPFKRAA